MDINTVHMAMLYISRSLGISGFGRSRCMAHSKGLCVSGGLSVRNCIAWGTLLRPFQSSWVTTVLPVLPQTSPLILQSC